MTHDDHTVHGSDRNGPFLQAWAAITNAQIALLRAQLDLIERRTPWLLSEPPDLDAADRFARHIAQVRAEGRSLADLLPVAPDPSEDRDPSDDIADEYEHWDQVTAGSWNSGSMGTTPTEQHPADGELGQAFGIEPAGPVTPQTDQWHAIVTADPYSDKRIRHDIRGTREQAEQEARERHGHTTGVDTADVTTEYHGVVPTTAGGETGDE